MMHQLPKFPSQLPWKIQVIVKRPLLDNKLRFCVTSGVNSLIIGTLKQQNKKTKDILFSNEFMDHLSSMFFKSRTWNFRGIFQISVLSQLTINYSRRVIIYLHRLLVSTKLDMFLKLFLISSIVQMKTVYRANCFVRNSVDAL